MEAPTTVTIDGVEHKVADLGPKVKTLINIRTTWAGQLNDERIAVAKSEAAIRALDQELLVAAMEVLKPDTPAEEPAANEPAAE